MQKEIEFNIIRGKVLRRWTARARKLPSGRQTGTKCNENIRFFNIRRKGFSVIVRAIFLEISNIHAGCRKYPAFAYFTFTTLKSFHQGFRFDDFEYSNIEHIYLACYLCYSKSFPTFA